MDQDVLLDSIQLNARLFNEFAQPFLLFCKVAFVVGVCAVLASGGGEVMDADRYRILGEPKPLRSARQPRGCLVNMHNCCTNIAEHFVISDICRGIIIMIERIGRTRSRRGEVLLGFCCRDRQGLYWWQLFRLPRLCASIGS